MKLKISNLSKTYKNGVKALDKVNLEIGVGMFGLLGPNGAGKSTLMRTIATIQSPDEGDIVFNKINVLKDNISLRKVLGYLPQSFGVYPNMTADSLLNYFAVLKGVSSKKERSILIDKLLEITNLKDARWKNVSGFSGGMKQRFGIAQLLIIVDEPTAGLDPAERQRFLNVLREIGSSSTVIFSTHIVDDVKELCNNMAIMNEGKILNHIKPVESTNKLKGKIWNKVIDKSSLDKMDKKYNILSTSFNPDNSLNIRIFSEEKSVTGFKKVDPDLDDVYFLTLKDNL